ncbi:ABC transporter ATP-binding protein [Papillibacter cinnamivorans]|uniref:Nucleoside ABC transporter ATP-binding protein n=1 Tax=Papillibacter cinnamivorans DSM 12816 TaxID=1122930 RepID=A0A1W2A382_9FIRM|nr:ABC transporter ATP-binding protein [Papillibacter cinnamivorans]SMC55124.1 nucleoside ABC transporter ATP-binding protein [Papillibacter cinnamivorans DSM 12816]
MSDHAYIELKNICKSFGSVVANRDVCLSVNKGEIHALLGENGSGKSTLVNMLAGIYSPDGGEIFIDGKPVYFSSPRDAIEQGIGMVHQHFKLVDVMTAKENIAAGSKTGFFVRGKTLSGEIAAIGQRYGLVVNPDKKVYNMSVGEKQTVEILKMLYRGARILILDEPTAVLTPQEIQTLFDILRNMKNEGCAIIIITHKLNEVLEISDRVTILRKGESVSTLETAGVSPLELAEQMVGRAIKLEVERTETQKTAEPLLRVEGLEARDEENVKLLSDMSFDLYGGEILGVAGIAGSGQKELCEIVAGLCKATAGSVRFMGEEILGMTPGKIIRKGISMSFIPEDRLGMGLVAGMNIVDNVMLKNYHASPGLFMDRAAGKKLAEKIVKRFDISTPSVFHIVKKLSGGNIQKVLLGREVDMNPHLLITAYPVRGLDIGASYNIYDVLNEQKRSGVGVLFIGEDLDVLLQLCDRILVLHAGRSMGIVDPRVTSKEELGLMMLGRGREGEAYA